jgi:hypothetical protein
MKNILFVLSISLFLFSCDETNESEKTVTSEVNESENEIIGKWKLISITDLSSGNSNSGQELYMVLKEDGTAFKGNSDGQSEFTWSLIRNDFCQIHFGFESCGTIKLRENQLEWKKPYSLNIYEKVDQ